MGKSIWYCHAVLFSSPNFHFFIFSTYLPYRFTASSFQKHPTWIFLNHSSTAHFFLTVDHIFNHVSDNIATSFKCCIFFCVFIIHFSYFSISLTEFPVSIRKFPAVKYHGHRFYSVYPIPGVCDKSNYAVPILSTFYWPSYSPRFIRFIISSIVKMI